MKDQIPLWAQIVGVFVPLVSAIIAGVFLVSNSSRHRRIEKVKALLEISEKLPKPLNTRNAIERAILLEIGAIDYSTQPWYIMFRYFSGASLLLFIFLTSASIFPRVFDLQDLHWVLLGLAIVVPVLWFTAAAFLFLTRGLTTSFLYEARIFELDTSWAIKTLIAARNGLMTPGSPGAPEGLRSRRLTVGANNTVS